MKLWKLNLGKMNMTKGLALGAGSIILAPIVLPVVGGVLKSLTKSAIKGGIVAMEQSKMIIAEAKETLEDIAAEAKEEVVQAQMPAVSAKKKAGK